jgi:hypothetical protein
VPAIERLAAEAAISELLDIAHRRYQPNAGRVDADQQKHPIEAIIGCCESAYARQKRVMFERRDDGRVNRLRSKMRELSRNARGHARESEPDP